MLKGIMDRVHYDAVLADLEARRKKLVEDNAQVEVLILGIRHLLAGVDHFTKAVNLPASLSSHSHAMTVAALRVTASVDPIREEEARISKAAGEAERVAVKSAETAAQRTAALRAHSIAESTSTGVGVALEPGGMGLTEAIEAAALEAKHNQISMVERVLELRHGTLRNSAVSMIGALLRKGRLHKGDDLIVRLVKDGEIQNLPPMRQDDALPIRRTSQYGDLQ
jgi:hypothetical protein